MKVSEIVRRLETKTHLPLVGDCEVFFKIKGKNEEYYRPSVITIENIDVGHDISTEEYIKYILNCKDFDDATKLSNIARVVESGKDTHHVTTGDNIELSIIVEME